MGWGELLAGQAEGGIPRHPLTYSCLVALTDTGHLVIKGGTYDQDNRPLHFIEVIAAGGRIEFAYLYGTMPVPSEEG